MELSERNISSTLFLLLWGNTLSQYYKILTIYTMLVQCDFKLRAFDLCVITRCCPQNKYDIRLYAWTTTIAMMALWMIVWLVRVRIAPIGNESTKYLIESLWFKSACSYWSHIITKARPNSRCVIKCIDWLLINSLRPSDAYMRR